MCSGLVSDSFLCSILQEKKLANTSHTIWSPVHSHDQSYLSHSCPLYSWSTSQCSAEQLARVSKNIWYYWIKSAMKRDTPVSFCICIATHLIIFTAENKYFPLIYSKNGSSEVQGICMSTYHLGFSDSHCLMWQASWCSYVHNGA